MCHRQIASQKETADTLTNQLWLREEQLRKLREQVTDAGAAALGKRRSPAKNARLSHRSSEALVEELDFAADLGAEFFGESDDEDGNDDDDEPEHETEVGEGIRECPFYLHAFVTLNARIGRTIGSVSDRTSDLFLSPKTVLSPYLLAQTSPKSFDRRSCDGFASRSASISSGATLEELGSRLEKVVP